MRKFSTALLTSAFALFLALAFTTTAYPALVRETCSCSAPDGSCSASVTCTGGCTKYCGNNDNCHAACSGAFGYLDTEVSIEMQSASYSQLVDELARASGKEINFTPKVPETPFNVGFKRAPLWEALKLLSEQGTVQVAGQDFEKLRRLRRSLLGGEKFSFCVKNTSVNTFVNDLAGLTGLPLRVTSGRPTATINLQLQDVGLTEMIAAVSEQTGTRIIEAGAESSSK
ncbi:MAG: hypothetical protein QOH49_3006 [Acidobacteriota bacterium]|jgi:hypothetical protein|nr:hypothetical protein [Acidobacteriota bacterium]